MFRFSAPLFFLYIVLFLSCSSTKQVTTNYEAEPVVPLPDLFSYININYKIKKEGITDTLNTVIDTVFATPIINPEYEITTKLKRTGDVKVEMQNRSFMITLPVDVEVYKKTFIKEFKAFGTLELNIVSDIDVTKNWVLITKTKLVDHTWIKRPKIDLGLINLPIETLSNIILKKIKGEIESSIDESIKQSYDMPAIMRLVAQYTFTPFEMDSVYGGWIQMVPDSTFISSAKNTTYYTEGKISLKTRMNLTSYKPTANYSSVLPVFNWKDNIKDSSLVKLILEFHYDHLASIAKKDVVGKVFQEGDKKIEILDVYIGKKSGKLQVITKVKGSFNGELSIMGNPKYNKLTGDLYLTNIEVSVKSGNVLHKAAVWLLQGKIRNELEKMTHISINQYLATAQNSVDEQVKLMNKKYKFDLNIKLGSINIEDMILRPDRINTYVAMKMRLDTKLDNLYFFQN